MSSPCTGAKSLSRNRGGRLLLGLGWNDSKAQMHAELRALGVRAPLVADGDPGAFRTDLCFLTRKRDDRFQYLFEFTEDGWLDRVTQESSYQW